MDANYGLRNGELHGSNEVPPPPLIPSHSTLGWDQPQLFPTPRFTTTPLLADREHVNDDERLATLAKELEDLGALELLQKTMPVECGVLLHYKVLLSPS